MLIHFLVLRWSGINFNISGFFITIPILIFEDLHTSILSTILYILNKKAKKNPAFHRLKFKTIFFIYTHNLQEHNFLMNYFIFALMKNVTIINIFNSDNSNIAVYIVLKFKSVIKKQIMTNYTFFTVVTFSKITSFSHINSIIIQHLLYLIFKKIFIKFICHLFVYNFISTIV